MTPRDELRQRLAEAVEPLAWKAFRDGQQYVGERRLEAIARRDREREIAFRKADAVLGVVAAHLADPGTVQLAAAAWNAALVESARMPGGMNVMGGVARCERDGARAALASILPPSEQA